MNPSAYMAELTKLLGFMSSWDRQSVLSEYAAKFEACDDLDALLAELGTPTRAAITLARSYVPSPPPEAPSSAADQPASAAPEDAAAVPEISEDMRSAGPFMPSASEACSAESLPAPAASAAVKPRRSAFGIIVSVILGILIALPIAIVLVCIGVPFFFGGLGMIVTAVAAMIRVIPPLGLFSDILLVLGGGLVASAVGLLLTAFGFWLSFALTRFWLSKVVFPAGRRLCRKKEVPQS